MSVAAPGPGQGLGGISADAVRAQLAKILANRAFANAPRSSRFLSYIVSKTVDNPGIYLSEYEIGPEVFDKNSSSFDPRIDNDVRVGATRLRDRLRRYYESDGSADPIVIEVPPGGFKPVFRHRETAESPPAQETDAIPAQTVHTRKRWLLAAGAVALLLSGAAAWMLLKPRAAVPTKIHIAVLPFTSAAPDPSVDRFCKSLTIRLTSTLAQLDQQSVWVVPGEEITYGGVQTSSEAREKYAVDLVLTGHVRRHGELLIVTFFLNDAATVKVVATEEEEAPASEEYKLEERVAARVTGMLEPQLPPQARETIRAGGKPELGPRGYYMEGRVYLDRGFAGIDPAIELFQRALAADKNSALAHAGLCAAYLMKYNLVDKDRGLLRSAEASCERADQLGGGLAPVRVALGMLQASKGNPTSAAEEFRKAREIDPENVEACFGLAKLSEKLKNSQEAEAALRDAIRIRPFYWRGHKELGSYYYFAGRYDAARRSYEEAMKLAPDNPEIYGNLSGVYIQLGKLQDAEAVAKEEYARGYANAHNNLAAAYYYQKRFGDALLEMKEAASLGSENDPVKLGELAHAYRWAGEEAKARELYRQAIRLVIEQLRTNPADASLRANLAFFYAETRDTEKALREIQRALGEVQNSDVLFRSVLVYERINHRDRAFEQLEAMRVQGQGQIRGEVHLDPDLEELRKDRRYQLFASGTAAGQTNQKAK